MVRSSAGESEAGSTTGPSIGHQQYSLVPPLDAHNFTTGTTVKEEPTITLFPLSGGEVTNINMYAVGPQANVGSNSIVNVAQSPTINTAKPEVRTVKSFLEELKEKYQMTDLKASIKHESSGEYVELSYKEDLQSITKEKSHQEFESFLQEAGPQNSQDNTKKVLLVMGDAGAGKSLTLKIWALERWENHSTNHVTQRIPLWINLSRCKGIYEDVIGNYLQEKFRNKFKTEELKRLKWCLFLDGYDEIPEKKNIYACNQFGTGWDVKIIITCRTQSIVGVRNDYEELFYPIDSGGKRHFQELQTLILQPFDKLQIEKFIESRAKDKASIIVQKINENLELKALISNPFLLEMMLTVVSEGTLEILRVKTRYELLNACVRHQVKRDDDRLKNETQLHPTPYGSFTDGLEIFAQNLALPMFTQKEEYEQLREYRQQRPINAICYDSGDAQNPWRSFFADLNHGGNYQNWQHERGVCLLEVKGNNNIKVYYGFRHKAILEYWAVRALISEYKSIYQYDETLKIGTWQADKLYESGLNQRLLNDELDFLDLLISQIDEADTDQDNYSVTTTSSSSSSSSSSTTPTSQQKSTTQKPLYQQAFSDLILLSKHRNDITIAAANAATILNRMNFNFSGMDLAGIKIAGADLCQSLFYATNLREADLRWINFSDSMLSEANLSRSKMLGIEFGQLPWLQHDGCVNSICYSLDGKYLAFGCEDAVKIWSTETKECLMLKRYDISINSVCFSENGEYLALGNADKTIIIWNVKGEVKNWRYLINLEKHSSSIESVNFSHDSNYLVSGSSDNTVIIWKVENWKCIMRLKASNFCIESVSFSPDGKYLAAGSSDDTIKIWCVDWSKNEWKYRVLVKHKYHVHSVAFSPDSKCLVSGGGQNEVKIWDMENNICTKTLNGNDSECIFYSVSYSPDGKYLAAGSSDNNTVKIWDVRSWEILASLEGNTDEVISISFSPNGKYLATRSCTNIVKIWSVESMRRSKNAKMQNSDVRYISFDQNNKLLLEDYNGRVSTWNVLNGKRLNTSKKKYDVHEKYSLDKKYFISKKDFGLTTTLHDIKNQKCRKLNKIELIEFSPDSKYLVLTHFSNNEIEVWELNGWKKIQALKHNDRIIDIKFSPDSQYLASISDDTKIYIWSFKEWKCIKNIDFPAKRMDFSHDSRFLAAGGFKIVKILSVKTWQDIKHWGGHSSWIKNIKFTPRSDYLVTNSDDNSVKLWGITEANNQPHVNLKWSTHYHFLAGEADLTEVKDLSTPNATLLKQYGAKNVPTNTASPKVFSPAEIQKQLCSDSIAGRRKNLDQTEPSIASAQTLACNLWQLTECQKSTSRYSYFILEGVNKNGYFIKCIKFNSVSKKWEANDLTSEQAKKFLIDSEVRIFVLKADQAINLTNYNNVLDEFQKQDAETINIERVIKNVFAPQQIQISTTNKLQPYNPNGFFHPAQPNTNTSSSSSVTNTAASSSSSSLASSSNRQAEGSIDDDIGFCNNGNSSSSSSTNVKQVSNSH
jgi:WD40 repeat protein